MEHISIQHISKIYPKSTVKALDDVSLNIEKGSIVGLLGPNGAGKTTLISILCNLISPDEGSVRIAGVPHTDKEVKNKVGLVPQDIAVYLDLSALENLRYFGAMQGVEKHKLRLITDELLEVLDLQAYKNNPLKTYSGGMKRRLNLAVAMLNNPEILILDEPTVGVDVQSRAAIMHYLTQLNKKEQTTIIYTSHLLAEAEHFCQYVQIIDHGKNIAFGTPRALLERYGETDLEKVFIQLTGHNIRNV